MLTQIHVVNDHPDRDLDHYARNKIARAIGAMTHRLDYVEVFLSDDLLPISLDKACSIEMKLFPRGWICVTAKDHDLRGAIDHAIQRAREVIEKTIDPLPHVDSRSTIAADQAFQDI